MHSAPNSTKRPYLALRAGLAEIVLVSVGVGLGRVVADGAGRLASAAPVRADELLVTVVAAVAAVLSAWLASVVAASALAAVPGVVGRVAGGLADLVAPRVLRHVVTVSLGLTVAAGVVPGGCGAAASRFPAVVELDRPDPSFRPLPDPGWSVPAVSGVGGGPDDAVPRVDAGPAAGVAPDPGWVPTAPVVRPQPDLRVLAPVRPAAAREVAEVVVRRGDTLWSIAARQLGPDASEAEIAAAWPRWFSANRHVVGSDPDLLLPGQVLRAPEGAAS